MFEAVLLNCTIEFFNNSNIVRKHFIKYYQVAEKAPLSSPNL